MMIFGYQQSWYVWLVKNALAIIFFSGIGFLNVSVIIMNILYGSLSIFIYINVKKEKHLHISIIGPGAVGKSTIIEKLKIFFKEKDIKIFDERDFLEGKFEEYMKNMPDNAYDMQKLFFSERLKQIDQSFLEKRTVMDRHLIDDFIFPRVHMELNNFNEYQKNQWFKVEKQYINKLSRRPKLDILFIIRANYNEIKLRRTKRANEEPNRKNELGKENEIFFKKVNEKYYDLNSQWYKNANKFSKKVIIFDDKEQEYILNEIKNNILLYLKQTTKY